MVNFIMIAVCIIAGMVFKATKTIHPDAHKGINTWILYIALPAVSLKYIPQIQWSEQMLFPVLGPVIVYIGSAVFMQLYYKAKHYSKHSHSSLILASAFSNTSFIGFPLIMAFFNESLLKIAIICDQTMFILLSTVGIIEAVKGAPGKGAKIDVKYILKRLFTFPPFIGCISALILSKLFNIGEGTLAYELFDKLAATVGPLALFSVGLQLKFNGWRKEISQISMTQLYKLLIAPLLVAVVALILGLKGDVAKITIFEAAMPTLITSSIISEQFRLNTRLINLIIGISIIIGFFAAFVWFEIVQYFF
ncbi:MAG: transporter [Pseudopedobacter saltans]|uniref:Transporter n=1 Tax=Pseudopedobacter saltans TaxID=151895 RepID=A0A2W5GLT6_9SPHI|nr:MAG: transporter [Pseudopedobacter saltans]